MEQRDSQRGLVKAGLVVTLLALVAYGCVGLTPAASLTTASSPTASAPDQSGAPQSGPETTVGPSKTKKPKHPPTTSMTTSEPTSEATDTTQPTDMPTQTATGAASPGGSGLHLRSLPIVLQSFVILNTPPPTLDYSASANYGEANLSAGFSPDPYNVGMTTGGPVDVSYLGGSCSGFATIHPDLRINFGGGGASLLRIYFVGSNGDAAMVVNDPYGNFYCVDDLFGTVNPTIDFNNPAGGAYDVWIASSVGNTTISGSLYITENSGNHP